MDATRNPIDEYRERAEAVQRAEAEFEDAARAVQEWAPDFLRDLGAPALADLLPDEATAAVSFCLTELGSIGFVLTRGAPDGEPHVVEVPDFTADDLDALLFGAGAPGEGWLKRAGRVVEDLPGWLATMDAVLEALGARLLRPILRAIPDGVERLILLPSGGLFLLPLHAVPLDGTGRRVCDRFVVQYGPSAGVLGLLQAKARRSAARTFYGAAAGTVRNRRLPGAERECQLVTALFTDGLSHIGPEATRGAAAEHARGRAYVHFACHGRYEADDPRRSGLELTDGRLTLADLLDGRLDLSAARLVVLSACDAGVPDVERGRADEYVGLPAGFLIAGVPCVVASLWAVDDFAGAMLVERFYRNHLEGGADFATALREAQSWLMKRTAADVTAYLDDANRVVGDAPELFRARRAYRRMAAAEPERRPFEHPHYWAVFTVNGW
ncbi:Similar to Q110X8_TRIEI TPR repeat containing protein OS=Microcystis sp. T1-4 GN=MICAI_3150001 PE=4 SV=1: CHAT [Gemmata massiliana]|uniref:CHAT domain-containing protein n=1 Tax=Gemmata massiliana TaxID=1210884 RepID=A0A6P2CTZ4_9BACT|nr:CHAT domain-containing protein [Gemmata massiliana]VTR92027.1 Similar to Q110X8_TRIEI TPR repeat containing protein OS=Microcystis sp. T1-4 GN=MICAI_3150001 PE=4 SV=1: CHAT [Gemmata massiliana]